MRRCTTRDLRPQKKPNRLQVMFLITRKKQQPIRLRQLRRKLNRQVLLKMSGSAMLRARPNENHAASAWPDLRSRDRTRRYAWDLNQPDSSEQPPMATGFFAYLREKRSSLRRCPISKMPQSLLLATSVESSVLPGWKTNRRSRFSRRVINPTFASGRSAERNSPKVHLTATFPALNPPT